MATVTELGPRLGIAPTCAALALPRATYYRRRRPRSAPPPHRPSPRALSAAERATVLALLHEPRFVDLAPAEVYATLLDAGQYLCSERTMYRVLAAHQEVRSSRNSRSRRFVVRITLRYRSGKRRWAMQASKSWVKHWTTVGNSRPLACTKSSRSSVDNAGESIGGIKVQLTAPPFPAPPPLLPPICPFRSLGVETHAHTGSTSSRSPERWAARHSSSP
jgi:hypothetical protein